MGLSELQGSSQQARKLFLVARVQSSEQSEPSRTIIKGDISFSSLVIFL